MGRRGGLKNRCRKTCRFESGPGHQSGSDVSMKLFRLEGVIRKTKVKDDIYVIAPEAQTALARAGQFADELVVRQHEELAKGWERYLCN